MDDRLEALKQKKEGVIGKKHYSLTCEDTERLDQVEESLEKYKDRFEKLGVKLRIKDRRNR